MRKITSENIYISSFQSSKIYAHNFRDESIKYNKIGSIPLSLELLKLKKEGFRIHKSKINNKLTSRDMINVDFKFKLDSSDTIVKKTQRKVSKLNPEKDAELINKLNSYIELISSKNWEAISQERLRDYFYENGFYIHQKNYDTGEVESIKYVFYKRSGSKSRTGRALFIREEFKDKMEIWSNMGLNIPETDEIDLAGIMAYQSLSGSGIKYTKKIPVDKILLITDIDSVFKRNAKVVRTGENGFLDSFEEETTIKNSLFDGQSLIIPEYLPNGKSMILLRQHFFKSAAFKCDIQLFLRDNCPHNVEFDTWELKDMFGNKILAKDVHMITTPNSLKALKFSKLLKTNKTPKNMYKYWKKVVKRDEELFGVCKNEYASKRGENLQQMSYQMINSLPISKEEVRKLASFEMDFIEKLKNDDEFYVNYLENTSDEMNSNDSWATLYKINKEISKTQEFKNYRREKIKSYLTYVKGGKIRLKGDYCVLIGNPLEMLLHSIEKLPNENGVLNLNYIGILKDNEIYNTLHEFNKEYTAFRNPHTGQNNVAILKNVYNETLDRYFKTSKNMVIINAINIPIQDIFSSCDYDSDSIALFDNDILLEGARRCYNVFPVAINAVSADKNIYRYTNKDKSVLDNILSKSQRNIGEVVNLGQLCMSKYYDSNMTNDELLKKIDVMTVLSCICIDLAKKFYDIDISKEIDNVRKVIVTNNKIEKPLFWSYVSEGVDKEKLVRHNTPMDYLIEILNEIPIANKRETLNIGSFIMNKTEDMRADLRQISKIQDMATSFLKQVYAIQSNTTMERELQIDTLKIITIEFNNKISKLKIREATMIDLIKRLVDNRVDIGRIFKALLSQKSFHNVWKTQ